MLCIVYVSNSSNLDILKLSEQDTKPRWGKDSKILCPRRTSIQVLGGISKRLVYTFLIVEKHGYAILVICEFNKNLEKNN